MKFQIEKESLLSSLAHIQSVVERRNTIPILANVLIDAKVNKLSMNATDMDIEIIDSISATVIRDGAVTTPAVKLFDIIRKLPDGAQIILEYIDNQLIISAGKSKFNLPTLSIEEFPVMTGGNMNNSLTIKADELLKLIENTSFAISNEEARYYLNGIYFHNCNNSLKAVATDGHRLAKSELQNSQTNNDFGVIIPKKTILELQKLLVDSDDNVKISISSEKIKFIIKEIVLTSKLIDGTFPDYNKVIPQNNTNKLPVNCHDFTKILDRVSTILDGKMKPIKIKISKGLLSIEATQPKIGSAYDEMKIDYSGEDIEIGFNAPYLLDIASQMKSGTIIFEISNSSSPSIVKDYEDSNIIYILMPMRI